MLPLSLANASSMDELEFSEFPESNLESRPNSFNPLIYDPGENSGSDEHVTKHDYSDKSDRKELILILALSLGFLGLQGVFTVFFGSGNFHLSSLGFSDAAISICWIAGPVAGLGFQPFVGVLSDNCPSKYGKRRPFILIGTIIIICAMLCIAWAQDIVTLLSGVSAQNGIQDTHEIYWDLLIFINLWIWIANLAIQPVQMGLRSLIVDLIPGHQQAQANAWTTRLALTGNAIGYSINSIDLTQHLSWFGDSQFRILCSLMSINLAFCISVTCYWAREERTKDLNVSEKCSFGKGSLLSLLKCMKSLSKVTRTVCLAQFFSWMAWFPFLFYAAKYVSELHERQVRLSTAVSESRLLPAELTRVGASAMLIFAASALLMSIILPLLAQRSTAPARSTDDSEMLSRNTLGNIRSFLSLRRIWLACHITFFACMGSTFFSSSVAGAYAMVAAMGMVFAGTVWIPFTLISKEIRALEADSFEAGTKNLAATVVGIHNMAIAAPQIFAVLGSSLAFFIAQRRGGKSHEEEMEVWILRSGVFSSLAAAWVIHVLPEG